MTGSPREGDPLVRLEPEPAPQWDESRPLRVEELRGRFDAKSTFTVGLEEELMLVDFATCELEPAATRVLQLVAGDERFKPELRAAQLELVTPVSGNAVAAAIHLAEARLELVERIGGELLIACAGTHPFSSNWGEVTDGERYRQLAQEYGWNALANAPTALHVHVAVPGSEVALAVYNAARSYLPELGALGANSPFLGGTDTGFASIRTELMIAGHRSGVPPAFPSWDAFVELVNWARRGGLLPNASHLWWDLRPHAVLGTLELRVADSQTRVEDAAALAAVFQCLVAWLAGRFEDGEQLPVHDSTRISENARRGARYGTRGFMANLETGEPEETRGRIATLLRALEPSAERLGLTWALLTARALLAGNGAERQRYVFARRGAQGLTAWLAEETAASAREYLTQRR